MKKKLFFLILIMLSGTIFGQGIIIYFEGTGASSTIDTVEVVNLTNCTSINVTDGFVILTPTGVEKPIDLATNSIKTYPNPFENNTTIEFSIGNTDIVKITVTDIAGKKVVEHISEMISGVHRCEFIANNSGIFFVAVSGTDFIQTSKVMCVGNGLQNAQLTYKRYVSENAFEKSSSINSKDDFLFTVGDMLKLKAVSGDYATVMTVEPTITATYTFEFVSCIDFDDNNYAVVEIGTQLWMAENLKTTHYSEGAAIPLVEDTYAWKALSITDKAYCYYNNNLLGVAADTYGALYTWPAATNGETGGGNIQGACPEGWHLPNDTEWTELIENTSGLVWEAGGKLKSTCLSLWEEPNLGATNEAGFSAIPGGYRNFYDGLFYLLGETGGWWSSTEDDVSWAWSHHMWFDYTNVFHVTYGKPGGLSVRCVRD